VVEEAVMVAVAVGEGTLQEMEMGMEKGAP
jgi:hypothetical protein